MNRTLTGHWNHWFAGKHDYLQLHGVHTGNNLAWCGFSSTSISGQLLSIPSVPAGVSGDIHCLSLSENGDLLTCLLLDISGHGPAIAALSELIEIPLQMLLNDLANRLLLNALNKSLVDMDLSGQFATTVSGIFDALDRMWCYAYTGHPNILLFENGSWSELSAAVNQGIPAGIVAAAEFYQYERQLTQG
jgi:serine phosphatase RsbU (regulator of sigma subunit)